MTGVIDFNSIQKPTKARYDGYGLYTYIYQLIGQKLLFVKRTYPNELEFHFGSIIESPGPDNTSLVQGSFVLGTQASHWAINLTDIGLHLFNDYLYHHRIYDIPPELFVGTVPDEKLDKLLERIGNSYVSYIEVDTLQFGRNYSAGYMLRLATSNGLYLEIRPTPDVSTLDSHGSEYPPVPDWELFTPYDRYLRVGPGAEWAYLPSNEVEPSEASQPLLIEPPKPKPKRKKSDKD